MKKFSFFLIVLFAIFSSCQKDEDIIKTADYIITGNVVNSITKSGIKGIFVSIEESKGLAIDTVKSQDWGWFNFKLETLAEDKKFIIKCFDTDSIVNGLYRKLDTILIVPQTMLVPCECPYKAGTFETQLELVMTRIK